MHKSLRPKFNILVQSLVDGGMLISINKQIALASNLVVRSGSLNRIIF